MKNCDATVEHYDTIVELVHSTVLESDSTVEHCDNRMEHYDSKVEKGDTKVELCVATVEHIDSTLIAHGRSEERRVGKECRL